MPFNEKLSLSQFQGVFFFILGSVMIYSIYFYPGSYKNWMLFLSVIFLVRGITLFFEDSKKRYKILTAPNGGEYDSKAESRIGDYFKRKKIKFYVHPVIKFPSSIWIFDNPFKKVVLKPDFYLPEYEVYVEYWGLMNDKDYKERFNKKMKIYERNDIKVISLYENNLLNLDWVFTQKLLSLIRDKEGNNLWNKN